MNEIFEILGETSYLIVYPLIAIGLFVISHLIINIINISTLFKSKSVINITDYDYLALKNNLNINHIIIYSLLLLYIHRYIYIKNNKFTKTPILVDIESFNNILLRTLYEKIHYKELSSSEIFKDKDIRNAAHIIKTAVEEDCYKKSFLKDTKYKYTYFILVPIIFSGLLRCLMGFADNNLTIYLMIEDIGISLCFLWLLYAHSTGSTLLGKLSVLRFKKSFRKLFKKNNKKYDGELLLSYYVIHNLSKLKKNSSLNSIVNLLNDFDL